MIAEGSGQSAEYEAYHGDVNEPCGAGFGLFVVPGQSSVLNQPRKGRLDDPAFRKDMESSQVVGAFDHFDLQLGSLFPNPASEVRSRRAAVHPDLPKPREPLQKGLQQDFGTGPFRFVGWNHRCSKDHSQCIHQEKPLPAFGSLARIVADDTAVRFGAHRLAVQRGCRRSAAPSFRLANQRSKPLVQSAEDRSPTPMPEEVVDRLPRREVLGEKPLGATPLDQVQNGIDHLPKRRSRTAQSTPRGQHWLDQQPLGVGQIGLETGDFHRLTALPRWIDKTNPPQRQALRSNSSLSYFKPTSQTGS